MIKSGPPNYKCVSINTENEMVRGHGHHIFFTCFQTVKRSWLTNNFLQVTINKKVICAIQATKFTRLFTKD